MRRACAPKNASGSTISAPARSCFIVPKAASIWLTVLAGAGEILVSSTVKDMATGSGIDFEARGGSQLKGVPGNWLLFAVTD